MKVFFANIETQCEKITSYLMGILGNYITFLIAIAVVLFWLTQAQFFSKSLHDKIENIILAVSFLTLFTIQKEFKRFSASLHIKLNELISTSERANNEIMIVEAKTESELSILTKLYAETAVAETIVAETIIDENEVSL